MVSFDQDWIAWMSLRTIDDSRLESCAYSLIWIILKIWGVESIRLNFFVQQTYKRQDLRNQSRINSIFDHQCLGKFYLSTPKALATENKNPMIISFRRYQVVETRTGPPYLQSFPKSVRLETPSNFSSESCWIVLLGKIRCYERPQLQPRNNDEINVGCQKTEVKRTDDDDWSLLEFSFRRNSMTTPKLCNEKGIW